MSLRTFAPALVGTLGICCGHFPAPALAQAPGSETPQPPSAASESGAAKPARTKLPTIRVRGATKPAPRRPPRPAPPERLVAPLQTAQPTASVPAATASAMTFTGAQVNSIPFTRPAEALEIVPGLIITQHSGEGKANQYFLRGYNLDHGTDLAIKVDGMPVNMPTHGHGQGYADLNFLIPELISTLNVRKGPYFADVGDFSSVGAIDISLLDRMDRPIAQATIGSFGYGRFLGMGATKAGGGTLLYAGEATAYNGPWTSPDEMRKLNGVLRFSQGTTDNGFTVTGMAYDNKWNSTDQVPLRAITSGQLGLFDAFDPSDGGNASRFSLSTQFAQTDNSGAWRANAYAIKSKLDLYSNFTYFLSDPVNGDQFHQHDDRLVLGGAVARTINGMIGGMPTETTFGLQTRYDDIRVSLTNTFQRQYLSTVRDDVVKEGNVGIYVQNTLRWTPWLRTILGWRGDLFVADVNSLSDANNSGRSQMAIGSPKASLVLGPFYKTELYVSAGMGFHSNDARGTTITEDPTDPGSKLFPSPFLVRTKGAEVGVRTKIVPGLESTVSVFVLDQASEILFVGDAGSTEASRPSERVGIEFTNHYRPVPWLALDADLALTRARFIGGFDSGQQEVYDSLAGFPQAQIGNAPGNYIPGAPNVIVSAGIELGEKTGWFGGLRYRYLGPRPLTEDNAFVSPATGLLNGRLGYRFDNGWRIQLDGFNLTNSRTDQITYAYGSLLKTDSLYNLCFPESGTSSVPAAVCANGVMDRVLHPVEPLAFRLTVAGPL